jgi:MoaA/NifB/PqqE/SkfB family radical SAM enzyme
MVRLIRKLRTAINNPKHIHFLVWRRLSAKFSYYFSDLLNAYSLPPESINIYPTDRCNLKCSMCFEKLRKPKPELEISDWIKIVDQIKKFRPRIHLSGGEPFVYPKIIELISYIKKSGLFLTITTNGTFLTECAHDIIRMMVNRIHISIDGPKETHDRIRGVEGTFDRIMEGVYKLKSFQHNKPLPVIRINSMINFSNLDTMQEVIKIGRAMNAEGIQFLHPFFLDPQSLAAHRLFIGKQLNADLNYWQGADITCDNPRNFEETHRYLDNLQKESSISVEIFPPFNFEQLKSYYTMDKNFRPLCIGKCQAMWNTATILPSGDVESCPDYIIGNCTKKNFIALWNNKPMRALRQRIRNRDFFTVCRACCFFYQ